MSKWDSVLRSLAAERSETRDTSHPQLCAAVRGVEKSVEAIARQLKQVEKNHERQRVVVNDARASTSRFEGTLTKMNSDIQYIQQQLEYVVISLEKEHGIVADHTEQLRLFAVESSRHDGRPADTSDDGTLLLMWLATWFYRPLVHFAKGCYTLLSPLINTFRSLSLFSADVLVRRSETGTRLHRTETHGDLLKRLQKGSLDPTSVSKQN